MNSTGDNWECLKKMLEKLKLLKMFFTDTVQHLNYYIPNQTKNQKVLTWKTNVVKQILALFDNLSLVEFTNYIGFLILSWFWDKDLTSFKTKTDCWGKKK